MKIMTKHWVISGWTEWKMVFNEYELHIFPSLIFEIDMDLYVLRFGFLGFRFLVGYSSFPYPKDMWEVSIW